MGGLNVGRVVGIGASRAEILILNTQICDHRRKSCSLLPEQIFGTSNESTITLIKFEIKLDHTIVCLLSQPSGSMTGKYPSLSGTKGGKRKLFCAPNI